MDRRSAPRSTSRSHPAPAPAPVLDIRSQDPKITRVGGVERFDFDSRDYVQVRVGRGDFVSKDVFVAVLEEVAGDGARSLELQLEARRPAGKPVLPIFIGAFEGTELASISRGPKEADGSKLESFSYVLGLVGHVWRTRPLINAVSQLLMRVNRDMDSRQLIVDLIRRAFDKDSWTTYHDWLLESLDAGFYKVVMVALTSSSSDDSTACVFLEHEDGRNIFVKSFTADALCFATRTNVPLYVDRQLWNSASLTAEAVVTTFGTTATALSSSAGGGVGGMSRSDRSADDDVLSNFDQDSESDDEEEEGGGAGGDAVEITIRVMGDGITVIANSPDDIVVGVGEDEDGNMSVIVPITGPDSASSGTSDSEGEESGEMTRDKVLAMMLDPLHRVLQQAILDERYEDAARLMRDEPLLRLHEDLQSAVREERYADASSLQKELDELLDKAMDALVGDDDDEGEDEDEVAHGEAEDSGDETEPRPHPSPTIDDEDPDATPSSNSCPPS